MADRREILGKVIIIGCVIVALILFAAMSLVIVSDGEQAKALMIFSMLFFGGFIVIIAGFQISAMVKEGAPRKQISKRLVLYCCSFVGINIILFLLIGLDDYKNKRKNDLFQKYYSSIEFEGNILSARNVRSCDWRNESLLCVEIVKTNTTSFFRYDRNALCLRIENGKAVFPIYDLTYICSSDFTYIMVNKDNNQKVILRNEKGEEELYPISSCYYANTEVTDLWMCD